MASVSSGFVSGGRAFGAGVVVRVSASGWVWSFRVARPGLAPAPACVCVPFQSSALAHSWARSVAACSWRCWVRPGKRCASAFEVKVALPGGLSARAARAQLPALPALSCPRCPRSVARAARAQLPALPALSCPRCRPRWRPWGFSRGL